MKLRTKEDRVVDTLAILIVLIFSLCCLYPLIYCLSMSFSNDTAMLYNTVKLLPVGFTTESYRLVLGGQAFWQALAVSVIVTVAGTLWRLICIVPLAYVMSKPKFVFRWPLYFFVLIPMYFGGGLVPSFLLIRKLKLYNTLWALFLPAGVAIWDVFLAKTFFRSQISPELIEAATIDGASEFQILHKIVIPLSTSIIAILALYAAVGFWNDYYAAMIYIKDSTLMPLQIYLQRVASYGSEMSKNLSGADYAKNAIMNARTSYVLVVVSCLPIFIFYPFLQKYFVKGVMLGSLKG